MASVAVDRLEPGDHACLTFSDPEERRDLLAAFVLAGERNGEKVICYADSAGPLPEHVLRGDVTVRAVEELWGVGAAPDARAMVRRLGEEIAAAEREGRRGLRISADMCWAAHPQAGAEQLLGFENEVAKLFADGRLTALCEYDREAFDPVTLGYAARTHPRTVTATVYHEDPVLRICRQHVPPGVRVAGELASTRLDMLRDALAEAVRLDPDVHLNLNGLRSLDTGAAATIVRAAAGLPRGRHMVVVGDARVGQALRVAGASGVRQMRVLMRDA